MRFTEPERRSLREWLHRGGLRCVDDHNHDVDGAVHRTPIQQIERAVGPRRSLPNDDALHSAVFRVEDGPQTTSHALNGRGDDLAHEHLLAARLNGRVAVIYSSKDSSSEWGSHPDSKHFLAVDNTRFGVNVIVYAPTRCGVPHERDAAAGAGSVRPAVELPLRLIEVAALAFVLWRELAPSPGAAAEHAGPSGLSAALARWSGSPSVPSVHASLADVPSDTGRDWLRALRGAGLQVGYDLPAAPTPVALAGEAVADPARPTRLLVAAPTARPGGAAATTPAHRIRCGPWRAARSCRRRCWPARRERTGIVVAAEATPDWLAPAAAGAARPRRMGEQGHHCRPGGARMDGGRATRRRRRSQGASRACRSAALRRGPRRPDRRSALRAAGGCDREWPAVALAPVALSVQMLGSRRGLLGRCRLRRMARGQRVRRRPVALRWAELAVRMAGPPAHAPPVGAPGVDAGSLFVGRCWTMRRWRA